MSYANQRGPRTDARAFTLIELLVVLAVIAVLLAILLPALAGGRRLAREGVCASNLRGLAQAISAYDGGRSRLAYPEASGKIWAPDAAEGPGSLATILELDPWGPGGPLWCPTLPELRDHSP